MSKPLEQLLAELTAAMDRNSNLLERMMANAPSAPSEATAEKDEDEDAPKPTRRRAAAAKKDADEDAPKPTRRRAAAAKKDEDEDAPKPTPRTAAVKKPMELVDFVKKFEEYLDADTNEEQDEAADNLEAICDYFGVQRISHIDPKDFDEALGYLQQAKDTGEIDFDAGASQEGDEDPAPKTRRRKL